MQGDTTNRWDVYKMTNKEEQFFFSFTCKNEDDYIKIFEQELIRIVESQKKNPYNLNSTPDYNVEVSL